MPHDGNTCLDAGFIECLTSQFKVDRPLLTDDPAQISQGH